MQAIILRPVASRTAAMTHHNRPHRRQRAHSPEDETMTTTTMPLALAPVAAGRREVTPAPWDTDFLGAVDRFRRHPAARHPPRTAKIYPFPVGHAEHVQVSEAADPVSTPDRPPPLVGARIMYACMYTMLAAAILRPLLLT